MTTLTFPTLSKDGANAMRWGLKAASRSFVSPLSGAVQTLALPGSERWRVVADFTGRAAADSALLDAFFAQLGGMAGRFYLYNFARPAPRGTITVAGVTINGTPAAGATTCAFAGCGDTKTLLRGDHFAVAGELKIVVGSDVSSNSGGAIATVTFAPAVRAAWSNGASVTLTKPVGTFQLESDDNDAAFVPGMFSSRTLAAVEAFA